MPGFEDRKGDRWVLEPITIGLARRLKAYGADLFRAGDDQQAFADLLFGDPDRLGRVLWLLCEPAAVAKGLDPDTFADRFDGPTLERATESLVDAVCDFFPRSRVAAAMKARTRDAFRRLDEAILTRLSGS